LGTFAYVNCPDAGARAGHGWPKVPAMPMEASIRVSIKVAVTDKTV